VRLPSFLLRAAPFAQANRSQINPEATAQWSLTQILPTASLFLIALLGTFLISWGTYKYQQRELERNAHQQLSYLTQVQRDQLDYWLDEQLRDAKAFAQDPLLHTRILGLKGTNPIPPADLLKRLQVLKTVYGYLAVSVLDPKGQILVTTEATPPPPVAWIDTTPPQAGTSAWMMWSLEAGETGSKAHVACRALLPADPSGKARGSLLLHLDFESLLASMHQKQPAFHATSETFLGCRLGNRAIPLNRTRLVPHERRNPNLNQKDLVGVQALTGGEGMYYGLDYRGVPALAAAKSLKALPCMVITKMDRAEATASLAKLPRIYTGITILALTTLGAFLLAWWRKSQAHQQADQARGRAEKELLEQRLKILSSHANDIVLLLDERGAVLDTNDRALDAYGYTYDQICTLNIRDLRTMDVSGDFLGQYEAVKREQCARFETLHVRKDGSSFPVEVSSRSFQHSGNLYVQSIIRDISERKQSEEQHRLIERHFRIVADQTYDWETWQDDQGRYIFSSPSCERITGYRPEEILDCQAFNTIVHPEDRPLFALHLDQSPEDHCQDLQFRIHHKDGRIRWIGHTCRPIIENGKRLGVRASHRDITVQHLAQEWLRESEERLRRILEATHVGTWEWNIQTGEVRFNERWAEMAGYTLAELSPLSIKTWMDLLHPDDQEEGEEALRRHFSGEDPYYENECRIRHRAGHWIWMLGRGQVTEWTENGQPLVMSGTHTDITTRKQAEETLRANEAKLDIALRSARMGVWHWDIQANQRYSDDQTNRLLGIDPLDGFAGSTEGFLLRVHPEDRETVLSAQTRSLEENLPYECEYRIVWPDGSIHFINSRGQVLRDASGQPTRLFGVLWDISERKQAELALRDSEKKYSSLFSSIREGFALHEILTDEHGAPIDYRFLEVNPAFEAMTGISRERWVGHTVKEILPSTETHWIETYGRVALTGEPVSFENYTAGLERWYQVHAFSPDHRKFAVISIDITAKRQAEEAMRDSEARFQTLVDSAPEPIFVETRGQFAYVNRAAQALFGAAEPRELIGTSIMERVHPDSRDIIQGKNNDFHTLSQNALENEIVLLRLDGTPVYVETSGVPIPFQGEPSALVFARDITAWKQSEAALSQERKLLEALFNSVPGLVYLYDQGGRLIKWNKRHETLTGYTGKELARMTLMDWYWGDEASQQAVKEAVTTTLETGFGEVEARLQAKDGRFIPMHFTASALSIDGQPYISGIGIDITDLKKAEAALGKLNEELEQRVLERTAQLEAANKEMEAFSYSVSHDLRAPLRGIDGFSRALQEDYGDRLDAEGQHCLDRVRHGARQMGLLIEDLLALSRVGRGGLHRRPLDLSVLIRKVLEELTQSDPTREIKVVVAPDLFASGDPGLIHIALENLLANAWKFTRKNPNACIECGTCIECGALPQGAETAFFIRDNGAGFDMAYADKLFNAFQRLHSTADFEGTGIGLAIVQRILQRHGGRIWVEAEPGKGATFFFTLPE